jgi:hypothetical protein
MSSIPSTPLPQVQFDLPCLTPDAASVAPPSRRSGLSHDWGRGRRRSRAGNGRSPSGISRPRLRRVNKPKRSRAWPGGVVARQIRSGIRIATSRVPPVPSAQASGRRGPRGRVACVGFGRVSGRDGRGQRLAAARAYAARWTTRVRGACLSCRARGRAGSCSTRAMPSVRSSWLIRAVAVPGESDRLTSKWSAARCAGLRSSRRAG